MVGLEDHFRRLGVELRKMAQHEFVKLLTRVSARAIRRSADSGPTQLGGG